METQAITSEVSLPGFSPTSWGILSNMSLELEQLEADLQKQVAAHNVLGAREDLDRMVLISQEMGIAVQGYHPHPASDPAFLQQIQGMAEDAQSMITALTTGSPDWAAISGLNQGFNNNLTSVFQEIHQG